MVKFLKVFNIKAKNQDVLKKFVNFRISVVKTCMRKTIASEKRKTKVVILPYDISGMFENIDKMSLFALVYEWLFAG